MKLCSKCGEWKPPEAFGKRAASRDGLAVWCKTCVSAARLEHYAKPGKRAVYNANQRANPARLDWHVIRFHPLGSYDADRPARIATYARAIAEGKEVDHVLPFGAVGICALHVSRNLQVLSAAENKSKSNQFSQVDALALTPDNHRLFIKNGLSVCC